MKVEQKRWTKETGWKDFGGGLKGDGAQLVLMFGSTAIMKEGKLTAEVEKIYPDAALCGCSTAGEICGIEVSDDSLVTTAVRFDHTRVECAFVPVEDGADSRGIGTRVVKSLDKEGLRHVLVLSDGLAVNGSDLVRGMMEGLPQGVTISGGLAGDGSRFGETFVLGCGESGAGVMAVGFYGDRLKVGCGSFGGWDPFGPERLITKSKGNVLFELDGKSALELYKIYLGEHADGLPSSGLLFPLSVHERENDVSYVRTILAVSEKDGSMTFAGDVPEGATARLMKANFDRLIDGAETAARAGFDALGSVRPELAVLISCVGRKLILKQRVEEEVEGVRDVLGEQAALTGFYSYGEISPFAPGQPCGLHNQTMTITVFAEV